jgi:hypothetical protein
MSRLIYISGKISGATEEELADFQLSETMLRGKGWQVVNPMKLNHDHDLSWESYMRVDIKAICDCDAMYMLSNYKQSRGATLEHLIAKALNLEMIYQD